MKMAILFLFFGLMWLSSLSSFDPYTYLFARCPSLYCVSWLYFTIQVWMSTYRWRSLTRDLSRPQPSSCFLGYKRVGDVVLNHVYKHVMSVKLFKDEKLTNSCINYVSLCCIYLRYGDMVIMRFSKKVINCNEYA